MATRAKPHCNVRCRQCNSPAMDDLGQIPSATVFAGQRLDPPWDGGRLYVCRGCHLGLRHPIRPDEEYEALYGSASQTVWVSSALRPDQLHVLHRIASTRVTADVLDVGCYDGVLLGALGPHYRKYGVEASAAAGLEAKKRGIDILATTIREIPAIARNFDVVCAVDVIEHMSDPRSFLATLADRLEPGGTLIVSTGTLDSRAWRFAGGAYWYCNFPEHISFISQAWAEAVSAGLGLDVSHVHRFAYGSTEGRSLARKRWRFCRKSVRARFDALMQSRSAPPTPLASTNRALGEPGLFADHMIICFEKRAAA